MVARLVIWSSLQCLSKGPLLLSLLCDFTFQLLKREVLTGWVVTIQYRMLQLGSIYDGLSSHLLGNKSFSCSSYVHVVASVLGTHFWVSDCQL